MKKIKFTFNVEVNLNEDCDFMDLGDVEEDELLEDLKKDIIKALQQGDDEVKVIVNDLKGEVYETHDTI